MLNLHEIHVNKIRSINDVPEDTSIFLAKEKAMLELSYNSNIVTNDMYSINMVHIKNHEIN